MISKLAYQKHSFFYLLTRKIYGVLAEKEGLSQQQRRDISLSLSKQVLAGEGNAEVLVDLFKWLAISAPAAVANFY